MPGRLFNWTAPLFALASRRWGDDDARRVAALLAPYLPAHGRLLDIGGGTGDLAALLAAVVPCDVTVLDASPRMLRYAEGLPGVEAVLGDAAVMPFAGDGFDAALVCDAFHHFTRPAAAASEIARVVRPGGGVVIAEIDASVRKEVDDATEACKADVPETRLIASVASLLGEPAGFLTPAQLEQLLDGAGIAGSCRRRDGIAYWFAGEVRPPEYDVAVRRGAGPRAPCA